MATTIAFEGLDEGKYEKRQLHYWEQLHQEFERLKAELGATNSELAQCLGISRQPLVTFMQDSRQGLPIRRFNLERLWDLLTDVDRFKTKHLSTEATLKRQELRHQGPDRLLKAGGFLPNSASRSLDINPGRYQQIQRIVSRLSSFPEDSAEFIKLTESLETAIMKAFSLKDEVEFDGSQLLNLSLCSEAFIEQWIERWMKDNGIFYEPEPTIKSKFKGAVVKLAVSGKYEPSNSEIFELFMSITENENLYGDINDFLKTRITQCQFKTLTFSLSEYVDFNQQDIREELDNAEIEAEKQLRFASLGSQHSQSNIHCDDAVSDVVIEASIICKFSQTDEDVLWCYSSSTTHFENMLAAIASGMGYESDLELLDLSTRNLGRKDYSLVKTSAAFRTLNDAVKPELTRIYQGIWVDRSAVLGTLQAVTMAVRGWLIEQFPDSESCKNYYEVCRAVAAIENGLATCRKVLNGYRIQQAEYPEGLSANDYFEQNVIGRIEALQKDLLFKNPAINRCYGVSLERQYCKAKLFFAHSALIEGDMSRAEELLADAEASLNEAKEPYPPLNVLYLTERMLQRFFAGDRTFISKRNVWNSELKRYLQKLSEYIYSTSRRYCGRFDSDIYLSASETFGRMGRFALCFSQLGDKEELQESIQSFLKAAYCSAKIGHKQRTAHWINNASRACCRLGYGRRAQEFANLAEKIIEGAIEPTYSAEYREAIMAEVNIARGERLMLVENNCAGALEYFLHSLKGSIYIGFIRLIADSLYNIARASADLENYPVRKTFEDAFGKHSLKNGQFMGDLKNNSQDWRENRIAVTVIEFINQNVVGAEDWSSVSNQFKQQAQCIWRTLANSSSEDDVKHPIEDEIDNYTYLCKVN